MTNAPVKPTVISPADLRRMLDDGGEIALLDVREEGVFARDGHLLLASNVPLSHLEIRISALLPRKSVRIVVCDGGEGLAQTAAERLTAIGYPNVQQLAGGTAAWKAAGFPLYTGVYVPSKAFGEYILHEDAPPEVTAAELHAWKSEGRDLVILDSRPLDEYRRNSIPGAIDCPSAELVYRTHDLLRSPDTVVVVNCGGRTRSIIGAQALINAGLENRVYALKDGTQGWHLVGYTLDHGKTDAAPMPSAAGAKRAREAAARLSSRFGVRSIGAAALKTLQADPARTVYLADVRSPEEFLSGHVPGSVSAPGGQLIQATDTYLAVRHAAVVLIDDEVGARAAITASWLLQMGWRDVYVLEHALEGETLARGPATTGVPGLNDVQVTRISPAALHDLLGRGEVEVADLAYSQQYAQGHIPGAWHVVRSRLRENLQSIPGTKRLVFTGSDGTLALLAAHDAKALASAEVLVLDGGTAGWSAAGYPLEQGSARLTGPTDDMTYKALERKKDEVETAIRAYLTWEIDLVNAIGTDPDFGFRRFPA